MDEEHPDGICYYHEMLSDEAINSTLANMAVIEEWVEYRGWWIAFAWVPRVTGVISIAASSIIVWIVLRDRATKLTKTRYRILLGMSVADIINSTAFALSSAPTPRGTARSFGAIGTPATCIAQGFAIQLGFAEPTYSCMLSLYFVLVIKWKMRERHVRRRIEPIMHAVAWLWPLGTALAGIGMQLFNPSTTVCYMEKYPQRCNKEIDGTIPCPCTRGADAFFYLIFFAGVQIVIIFVVILWSLSAISVTVRQLEGQLQSAGERGPGDNGGGTVGRLGRLFGRTRRSVGMRGPRDAHQIKANAMAVQAFLYIWAFLVTYTLVIFMNLAQEFGLDLPLAVHLLMYTLLPLQGFWNFLAFMHPRVKFLRSTCPFESKWNIFKFALIGDPGHGSRGARALSAFQGDFEQRQLHIRTFSAHSSSGASSASVESDASYYMNEMRRYQREERPECTSLDDDASFADSDDAVDLDSIAGSIDRIESDAQNTGKDSGKKSVPSNPSSDYWDDEPIVNGVVKIGECHEPQYEDFPDENSDFVYGSDCGSDEAIGDGEEVYVNRREHRGESPDRATDIHGAEGSKEHPETAPKPVLNEAEACEPIKKPPDSMEEPLVSQSEGTIDAGAKEHGKMNGGPAEEVAAEPCVPIEEEAAGKISDMGVDETSAAPQQC
uniref:Uncharacterized protein n=1 Tax=Odontella aurita TaxID=265563 RepID=A0A7S4HP79_9STRA|mmetsp:Transcript_13075/g.38442  ORF Transcript_13075/g.38442 Transcript_13075/m.38442 type:complete len:663 (+) Transcript_13075:151-2139(+)|eukprot:CAMPEP_0113559860 /NCGR_PEP_ID=MMETSP0015_2-20120614/19123_1 /TAXON_ID=2838 /ORGANISM="Odontella" /LENGTH=662 /DNA_ID=CAMNT_0000461527 /DNA_START=118 /DNA_END=2106 /DNA_ORIENTATION=- /assembly_acc=CAM_ASM_000160